MFVYIKIILYICIIKINNLKILIVFMQDIKHIKISFIKNNIITYIINYNKIIRCDINLMDVNHIKWLEHNSLKDYYLVGNKIEDFYLKINT
jgi:hypothetical protein